MTTTTARAALHAKLRALLAKTTEAGCTEAEALAAAALARRLMDTHNVEMADLAEVEDWTTESVPGECWRASRRKGADSISFRREILYGVGKYTDTHIWYENKADILHVTGRESDALFARWLLEALSAFALRAWGAYELDRAFSSEPFTASRVMFLAGLARRLTERLLEARDPGTGTGLVVNRQALARAESIRRAEARGIILRSGKRSFHGDRASGLAGADAANRATFARPVNGGGMAPRLLR